MPQDDASPSAPSSSFLEESKLDLDKITESDRLKLIAQLLASPESRKLIRGVLKKGSVSTEEATHTFRPQQNTYCCAKYGNAIKPTLDEIAATKRNKMIRYSQFKKLSPGTVKMMVYGAMMWLATQHPNRVKYAHLRHLIRVSTTHKEGLLLKLVDELEEVDAIVAEDFAETDPTWREELDKWVEESQFGDKPFIRDGLELSPADIAELKVQLASPSIVMDIKPDRIAVVKLKQADINKP